jgi:hypothetical protein
VVDRARHESYPVAHAVNDMIAMGLQSAILK